jgi:putative restriction endonuclease
MQIYVGITDGDWFEYLSERPKLDEVNFWQPSGKRHFKTLAPGEPFLFKLHSPNDFIVGGGLFGHHSLLPVSLAWAAFEEKNGAQTIEEMKARIARYRRVALDSREDYIIGCILLESPVFFERKDWIPVPDWRSQIVQGRGYDSSLEPGKSLWERVESVLQARSLASGLASVASTSVQSAENRFGSPQVVLPRLGQGSFRIMVTDAYHRQCAFTGSHVLHVLEAAHIKPYSKGGTHELNNGVLLRQDYHTLFDHGYITVTKDYKVEVNRRIKQEFDNGKEYYAMHGKNIIVPNAADCRPSPEILQWHNDAVYLG